MHVQLLCNSGNRADAELIFLRICSKISTFDLQSNEFLRFRLSPKSADQRSQSRQIQQLCRRFPGIQTPAFLQDIHAGRGEPFVPVCP
jgi:hypothetical protein